MSNNGKLLTVKQVAEQLRRSDQTIWRWIKQGYLPAFKVRDGYLIYESAIKKLLKTSKVAYQ